MTYIYNSLKPHLCKDVIGIIEDMVRWSFNMNDDKEFDLIKKSHGYTGITIKRWFRKYNHFKEHIRYSQIIKEGDENYVFLQENLAFHYLGGSSLRYYDRNIQGLICRMDPDDIQAYYQLNDLI